MDALTGVAAVSDVIPVEEPGDIRGFGVELGIERVGEREAAPGDGAAGFAGRRRDGAVELRLGHF